VKNILIAAALTLIAGEAHAQSAFSWTGPYVGLHAGGDLDNPQINTQGVLPGNALNIVNNARPPAVSVDRNNIDAGGQVGYNQAFGRFVLGVEGDISAVTSKGQINALTPTTFGTTLAGSNSYFSQKLDYLGTGRGRIGY